MIKRILSLAFALSLALVAASCAAKQPPAEPTETAPAVSETQTAAAADDEDLATPQTAGTTDTDAQPTGAGTQTDAPADGADAATDDAADDQYGPLFRQYVRALIADGAYTVSMRQSGVAMVTAVSGKDSALDSDMAGVLHFTLVNKGGKYYMVMHGTRKYAEMTAADYAKQADSLQSAALDLSDMRLQGNGEETIAGKRYQTETYDEGGRGTVTYFFTDAGLARVRVVKDGKTTDVESFTVRDEADADLFEIPSGYTLVSDPSQLMT